MSRLLLAFSCFFRLLFRGRLPSEASAYLPPEALALPIPSHSPVAHGVSTDSRAVSVTGSFPVTPSTVPVAFVGPRGDANELRGQGALALLALFQREGRLVDFLRESLDEHDDVAIGAAVRDIHRGCKKVLEEHLRIEPVMPGQEDAPVTIPRGFDPGEVRLIGKAAGEPPFRGILVHRGWRVVDVKFPVLNEAIDRRVLAPAEVRLP